VGLPYDLYGKNLIQLDKTKKFIERLKDIFVNMEVV
jgi:RNase H-fold protein (predicted Holliday junction resolvase)